MLRSWACESVHSTSKTLVRARERRAPRRRRYQLDSNKLACANSPEAACQGSSPRFPVSQVDCVLPNGRRNRRFPESSQSFSDFRENWLARDNSRKYFFCTVVYVCSGERVLLGLFREPVQRDHSATQASTLKRWIPARYLV